MSKDDRTPAQKRFDDVLDGIVAEAVENERGRCLSVVVKAKMDATQKARYAVASSLRECEHAIRTTGSESQPPADELMTIETVMRKALSGQSVNVLKADLAALVQAQVRRDAETCFTTACSACGKLLLESAGLE